MKWEKMENCNETGWYKKNWEKWKFLSELGNFKDNLQSWRENEENLRVFKRNWMILTKVVIFWKKIVCLNINEEKKKKCNKMSKLKNEQRKTW